MNSDDSVLATIQANDNRGVLFVDGIVWYQVEEEDGRMSEVVYKPLDKAKFAYLDGSHHGFEHLASMTFDEYSEYLTRLNS